MSTTTQGHRARSHATGLVIEAWAPSRDDCFEQAVTALVRAFADATSAGPPDPVPFALDPANDEELLVQLLEEVLYLVETLGVVPATTEVVDTEDGGVAGSFDVVPLGQVEVTGVVPKAIARGDLSFAHDGESRWSCRVTVEV